jgi:D-3-phosphoglycerate dehydrogenase / 2-oxoglutarate reductase
VAVIGLGRIGRAVAELMQAVGATVVGTDPMPDLEWATSRSVQIMDLQGALACADIVSLHLANHPDHPFQMTAEHFSAMKPRSLLINLARGQFVNEDDLVSALKAGHLAGAGLDVYSAEPYSGPLSELDDVVLTPHVATLTEESRLVMETEATANVLKALRQG